MLRCYMSLLYNYVWVTQLLHNVAHNIVLPSQPGMGNKEPTCAHLEFNYATKKKNLL